ncbi:MAG: guanylate kinase [Acidobacteria bacterium]|nr:guanylate kinase [Acidobacteriota bacterium]NIQ84150.1 guanylate kinase [Acidobacteriota bacterium]
MSGILFVISAPSGTGKTTVARRVQQRVEGLDWSVSFTTREPREGEVDGREYRFVGPQEFSEMEAAGAFLECADVFGHRYGTGLAQTREKLAQGRDLLLEIDVQGAAQIRNGPIEAVSVMILPPDFATLEARLTGRGSEAADQRAGRLAKARTEAEEYRHFNYMVVNADLEPAVEQVASIVRAERRRVERCGAAAQAILDDFPHPA